MGIFRQFPYSNFHEMNLDWILSKIKELWNGVDKIDEKVDEFIISTEPTIRDQVDKWLDDHPEATTTVEDHSLTEIKFTEELANKTIKDYVTPQMFGAVGDGVTDDTQAFKDAFDSGKQVLIPEGSYNIDSFIITDESVIIENYGTFNNKKIIVSDNFAPVGLSAFAQDSFSMDPYNLTGFQSVYYNPNTNSLILGIASSENQTAGLVEIDWSTKVLKRTLFNNKLGHCNDITINNNILYIAPINNNKIVTVDLDLFTFREDIELDGCTGIYEISYDENNNIYYVMDYSGSYIYDSNFIRVGEICDEIPTLLIDNNRPNNHIEFTGIQSSIMINGQFVSLAWFMGARGFSSYGRLFSYDFKKKEIKEQHDIRMFGTYNEPEGLTYINGDLYLFSYSGSSINYWKIQTFIDSETCNFEPLVEIVESDQFSINKLKAVGNSNQGFIDIALKTKTDITAGTSYYLTVKNISTFQGVLLGFSSNTPVIAHFYGTTINLRAFQNISAGSTVLIRGPIMNGYTAV